ncbi:aspartic-type endopeptidase [Sporothrix brasiliensis 5110]|uniref:Aspartic-type endopeptidase n=1 Tax=Sporothrix brasiliensis 5110 TaxID=1398154 RepID=A0A0C2IVQ5_9PEZI|nr:aspartic-type endopeptidase [Sporothrix brasiliensis 5110]KIH93206.1 aspartic-type endopeptidase [Sporothrix brasiliensis 5110]
MVVQGTAALLAGCALALIHFDTVLATNSSTDCAPEPLAITIGNVTLSNNQVARGLRLSIGSPPQSFAFLPQWPMNNSFVYGTDGHCTPDLSSAACTTFRGGAYDAFSSSSRTVPAAAAHPVDAAPYSSVSVQNATASTSLTLTGFPMGVPLNDLGQQGYHPMNAVGLGFNSTLLSALKASGRIASRTWSMFWGRDGADQTGQMDGVFVLGGYDSAKVVAAQKYTLPLAGAASVCPSRMVLSITDLVLNFANGTNASLFPRAASTALQTCITPDYPVLMTLPADPYFQALETLTNTSIPARSQGLAFFANRYLPGAAPYTGDLTLTFQSGLAVRIPNDQLIVPDRTIDAKTGQIQANSSGMDTTILAIQDVNADDMTQLGRPFLSAAYVMLNQDAGTFTLWQANPTTQRRLVAVDETNADVAAVCATTSSGGNNDSVNATAPANGTSSTGETTPGSSSSGSNARKPSTGAIVGAVAGGAVVVAALIGVSVFYCLRRRQRRRTMATTSAVAAAAEAARRKFDPGRPVTESTTELTGEAIATSQPQLFHQLDAQDVRDLKDAKAGYHYYQQNQQHQQHPPMEMEDSSCFELRDLQNMAPRYEQRRQTPQYELQG